jgi:hypothetical protein
VFSGSLHARLPVQSIVVRPFPLLSIYSPLIRLNRRRRMRGRGRVRCHAWHDYAHYVENEETHSRGVRGRHGRRSRKRPVCQSMVPKTRLANQPSSSYNNLYLRGSVNLRYNGEEGTFKVSGTYGVQVPPKPKDSLQ